MNPDGNSFLDTIFDALVKGFVEGIAQGTETETLAENCKMRRFYLMRHEDTDPDKTSGTGIIAEGVVYEDKTVAMRWKTTHKSTAIYNSIEDLLKIHGHGGKTEIKYIDAEKA